MFYTLLYESFMTMLIEWVFLFLNIVWKVGSVDTRFENSFNSDKGGALCALPFDKYFPDPNWCCKVFTYTITC